MRGLKKTLKKHCCNVLVQTSKKRSEKHYKVQSQCSYAEVVNRAPVLSIRNKCTNYMVKCVLRGMDMWTYNADKHYLQKHSDVKCPIFVTEDERKAMLE